VIVLTPLYAAGSIADEKERGTLDFLLSSPLPHYQILLGKLLARLAFVGSILAVGWPVLMLTFLFGGVDFEHLLGGFAISAVTAIFLANWGIMLACMKKNFRETLPGIAAVLLLPAIIGMFGCCLTEIAAASPVTILGFIFRSWLIGDPAKDSTWPMVAIFSALYLLPTILLFATAHKAFGEQSHRRSNPIPRRRMFPSFSATSRRRIARTTSAPCASMKTRSCGKRRTSTSPGSPRSAVASSWDCYRSRRG